MEYLRAEMSEASARHVRRLVAMEEVIDAVRGFSELNPALVSPESILELFQPVQQALDNLDALRSVPASESRDKELVFVFGRLDSKKSRHSIREGIASILRGDDGTHR